MLVVSLRGINFGFWSHLGCSGQTPSYLAVKVSFRVAREKVGKKIVCVFRGQKKLGPCPDRSLLTVSRSSVKI